MTGRPDDAQRDSVRPSRIAGSISSTQGNEKPEGEELNVKGVNELDEDMEEESKGMESQ